MTPFHSKVAYIKQKDIIKDVKQTKGNTKRHTLKTHSEF